MSKDKYSKGIGNRSTAGSGTWAGTDPNEPAPRPLSEEHTPELPLEVERSGEHQRRELKPPPETQSEPPAALPRAESHPRATPAVSAQQPPGPGLGDQITGVLTQIGDLVLNAGRFLMARVIRPSGQAISKQWQVIREKMGMEDRLIEGDTYDPGRARDWEKFKKGKRSSSYLQDDEDKK